LAPLATINIDYSNKTGIVHIIFTTVSMDEDSNQWFIDIPYLDAYFAASQKIHEIADLICTVIKLV
jgi:hypothetical protein